MLADIMDDIAFAEQQKGDLRNLAAIQRYVVAINEDMTMDEWLAAARVKGWHEGGARNRFNESRNLSKEMDDADARN